MNGRPLVSLAASVLVGIIVAATPISAYAQMGPIPHSGTVKIENEHERSVLSALRCMCGGCARDLLSTCPCAVAEEEREEIRAQIAAGMSKDAIIAKYAQVHGADAIALPPSTGAFQAIWAVPLAAAGAGAIGLVVAMRRWKTGKGATPTRAPDTSPAGKAEAENMDARLDHELKDFDD